MMKAFKAWKMACRPMTLISYQVVAETKKGEMAETITP
jgi:hypothetical protein